MLLCVRDGVFNTIQPRGLAGIARKYELSWQECAKYVGVSSYELFHAGLLDAVIDFVPGEADKSPTCRRAIGSAIRAVERAAERFVAATPEVFEHYRRSVFRYLDPSEPLQKLQHSPLSLLNNPTEQPNVFGAAFRHLRYLGLRRRIQSTTQEQYGRLSAADVPRGDLRRRVATENTSASSRTGWLIPWRFATTTNSRAPGSSTCAAVASFPTERGRPRAPLRRRPGSELPRGRRPPASVWWDSTS